MFFDPPGGRGWAKIFHPDHIRFLESLSPLFPGLSAKPVPAKMAYPGFISNLLSTFLCCWYRSIFPHK